MSTEAVYAAEDAAFGGTDFAADVGAAGAGELAAGLLGGEWWRSCGAPAVEVRRARAGATTSSARSASDAHVLVRIAEPSSSTVSHELAHALAGVAHGHDATFRAAHVDVVAALAGRAVGQRLAKAYRDHGIPPGRRVWPPPVRISGPGFVVL